jgi:hypothetical protein
VVGDTPSAREQGTRRVRRGRDELPGVLTQIASLLDRCSDVSPSLPGTISGTINSEAIEFFVQASDIPTIGG